MYSQQIFSSSKLLLYENICTSSKRRVGAICCSGVNCDSSPLLVGVHESYCCSFLHRNAIDVFLSFSHLSKSSSGASWTPRRDARSGPLAICLTPVNNRKQETLHQKNKETSWWTQHKWCRTVVFMWVWIKWNEMADKDANEDTKNICSNITMRFSKSRKRASLNTGWGRIIGKKTEKDDGFSAERRGEMTWGEQNIEG